MPRDKGTLFYSQWTLRPPRCLIDIYCYIELLSGLFNPYYVVVVVGAGPADAVHGVLRGGVRVGAAGQPLRDRGGGPQQGEL